MMDVYAYLAENGRLPRIDDDPPPWRYRAWLLSYAVENQRRRFRGMVDRWGYYLECLDLGRLPDHPIPQVYFERDKHAAHLLTRWINILDEHSGGWSSMRDLVDFLSFALGTERRDPNLPDKVSERLYREINLVPWLVHPYDYLGEYIAARRGSGWNPNAFYPTPASVVRAKASMIFADAGDCRAKTVLDPACGTGRLLLEASNYSLRLYGQDVDPLMVQICKINGALFAPWMAFPLPESVFGEKEKQQWKSK